MHRKEVHVAHLQLFGLTMRKVSAEQRAYRCLSVRVQRCER